MIAMKAHVCNKIVIMHNMGVRGAYLDKSYTIALMSFQFLVIENFGLVCVGLVDFYSYHVI